MEPVLAYGLLLLLAWALRVRAALERRYRRVDDAQRDILQCLEQQARGRIDAARLEISPTEQLQPRSLPRRCRNCGGPGRQSVCSYCGIPADSPTE